MAPVQPKVKVYSALDPSQGKDAILSLILHKICSELHTSFHQIRQPLTCDFTCVRRIMIILAILCGSIGEANT